MSVTTYTFSMEPSGIEIFINTVRVIIYEAYEDDIQIAEIVMGQAHQVSRILYKFVMERCSADDLIKIGDKTITCLEFEANKEKYIHEITNMAFNILP